MQKKNITSEFLVCLHVDILSSLICREKKTECLGFLVSHLPRLVTIPAPTPFHRITVKTKKNKRKFSRFVWLLRPK